MHAGSRHWRLHIPAKMGSNLSSGPTHERLCCWGKGHGVQQPFASRRHADHGNGQKAHRGGPLFIFPFLPGGRRRPPTQSDPCQHDVRKAYPASSAMQALQGFSMQATSPFASLHMWALGHPLTLILMLLMP